jgi:hypothetical protein
MFLALRYVLVFGVLLFGSQLQAEIPLRPTSAQPLPQESLTIADNCNHSLSGFINPTIFGHRFRLLRSSWRLSMVDPTSASYKSVLSYLREMVEICRHSHRPDIARDYEDAWQTAVTKIYGALPRRPEYRSHYVETSRPAAPPLWRKQMLSKPFRRIIGRTQDEDGIHVELLECGHKRHCYPVEGETLPARRRCSQCAVQVATKKQPASATAPRKKAVSA